MKEKTKNLIYELITVPLRIILVALLLSILILLFTRCNPVEPENKCVEPLYKITNENFSCEDTLNQVDIIFQNTGIWGETVIEGKTHLYMNYQVESWDSQFIYAYSSKNYEIPIELKTDTSFMYYDSYLDSLITLFCDKPIFKTLSIVRENKPNANVCY
jgi:hypothetical protein